MNIILNGERREIRGETVVDVLAEIGLEKARVATALNGEFLPASRRGEKKLSAGDALEVVSAMQGG
jgi:sulfur carrier protein